MEATNFHTAQLYQEYEKQREAKDGPCGNTLAGFLLLIEHALVVEAISWGMVCLKTSSQCRGRLLRAITGRGAADDRRRPVLVVRRRVNSGP